MRAGALFILILLANLGFAASCEADVIDVYVDISVKEYLGDDVFVPVTTESLALYEHAEIFNYTRIYLVGFDSSDMCSPTCMDERPTSFTANFVVTKEYGGDYEVVEVFGMDEGEESFSIKTEDHNISFSASGFWSKLSCDLVSDESFEYCADGTRKRKCSYTRPYRCIEDSSDDLVLKYQPDICGKPNWITYSEGCAEGEISYCDSETNSVYRKTCEDNKWVHVLMDDCGKAKCMFNATNAYCSDIPMNSCSDGTLKGGCSTNKPYYCNEKAELIKSPKICGCPENADYDPITLSCDYDSCVDGTLVGNCSLSYYCNSEGELVEDASTCGCQEGYTVQNDSCVKDEEENETVVLPPPPVNDTVNESVNDTESEPVTVESSTTKDNGDDGTIPIEWALAGIFLVIVLFTAYIFFKH
jgi:hypothetical protein